MSKKLCKAGERLNEVAKLLGEMPDQVDWTDSLPKVLGGLVEVLGELGAELEVLADEVVKLRKSVTP